MGDSGELWHFAHDIGRAGRLNYVRWPTFNLMIQLSPFSDMSPYNEWPDFGNGVIMHARANWFRAATHLLAMKGTKMDLARYSRVDYSCTLVIWYGTCTAAAM